ncbi:MAG: regulator [Bacteroidaceae bacterium]|nr:regulator [Bacteroidaceae bacterium]
MKKTLCLFSALLTILLLLAHSVQAQQIGEWKVYPSYTQATQNIVVGNRIYSLCDGNLLAYDTEDTEVVTYDCLHQLNGVHVSHMAYSAEAGRLMLVYDDANIDLLDAEDNVQNLAALRDKPILNKEVTAIFVEGKRAYLATGFGFVEVDMEEGTFLNTYQIGLAAKCIAVSPEAVFLGTTEGIYTCSRSQNMHQKSNWQLTDKNSWQSLAWFDSRLVGLCWGNVCIINLDGGYNTKISNTYTRLLKQSGEYLLWLSDTSVSYCTSLSAITHIAYENAWNDASVAKGIFWASEGSKGLNSYRLDDGNLVSSGGPIQPNSPARDLFYRMSWVGDRLLVAGGINTVEAIYNPATAMYFENNTWTTLQEMDTPSSYPNLRLCNTTHLVQDPADANHHFASIHRVGLCEYRDGKCVRLYNCDNSPLASILPNIESYYNYVSCAGLQYDSEGNLWMLNSETDTIVRVLRPNGRWSALYYGEIAGVSLCDDYLFHSSGLIFLNSRRTDNAGFFCFDTNGTLDNPRDDRHCLRSSITNQDGTVYNPYEFYCMTEDLDGRIWCGTDAGLFVINDAGSFLDNEFQFEQVKIPRNDGSGLADYLLSGVPISCITIDGANRKWIGTIGSGVYLVSADGTETIHHFQAADTPLLDDNVLSIAIHPSTGLVMIGSEKGLCSYFGDATQAEEALSEDNVLVFPNPVKPDYTGPIVVRGLTMDAEVKILSSTGQLVWSGTSAGGTFTWNGCNKSGRRVASGIYHVVANNSEGKKAVVARIILIR